MMKRISTTARSSRAALCVTFAGAIFLGAPRAEAQSPNEQLQIQQGLAITPVKLNMTGKDPNLVGYGSYLVNAVMPCNDCHSAGPATEFSDGGNPYFSQHPAKVNPATFMGGGRDFDAFPDPAGPFPHVISRNLTPNAGGLPIGGDMYDQFVQVMRTGADPDHVHPTCTGAPNGKCLPPPFSGDLLQIMPWPFYQNLTDHDLQAIYAYLSAIPCVEGGPGEPANRCVSMTAKTTAVAGPKNITVTAWSILLDGTASKSADGKSLSYLWTIPSGSPSAAITGANTPTPTVQFTRIRGTYMFQLTVTDSAGNTSADVATVTFQ